MTAQRAFDPAQALVALAILGVALAIHYVLASRALADLQRPDRRVRTWSKDAWMVVIIVVGLVGPLAYFAFGRDDRP